MGTAVFSEKKKEEKMVFLTIFYWNLNETIITVRKKKGKMYLLKVCC